MESKKSFLSKECINFLNKNNILIDDFLNYNDFGGVYVRHTKKAIETYKKLNDLKIFIWKG